MPLLITLEAGAFLGLPLPGTLPGDSMVVTLRLLANQEVTEMVLIRIVTVTTWTSGQFLHT